MFEDVTGATFPTAQAVRQRLGRLDTQAIAEDLDRDGIAVIPNLLDSSECRAFRDLYADDDLFRSKVVMKRHNFGSGEYKYFRYALPPAIAALREAFYGELHAIANNWHGKMRLDSRFPTRHGDYLKTCHSAGQTRPTPLLLKYEAGDYNCLHQDRYGDHVFPLQVAILLSRPGVEFSGGEFVVTEQRPRMQSRARVAPLDQGSALVFPVNDRPVQGGRGFYRVKHRHGVSALHAGQRFTLGIIFHDAR